MPFILETIVATRSASGSPHVRPYGLHRDGADWLFMPFRPSPAIDNVLAHPFLTASCPGDMRVLAGFLTGRTDWPLLPADHIDGVRLASATSHMELEAIAFEDDPVRPRFRCRVIHEAAHQAVNGFNRAQAAILEAAILSTRLDRLPADKIAAERAYLQIAIDKCAGLEELEAWGWITARIDAHLAETAR